MKFFWVRSVPEFAGPDWQVGRFTDDTQMMICVAEWLINDKSHSPADLFDRFAQAYEPSRRYGPGTEALLRMYAEHKSEWRELATAMFPFGSYGNGSAMRVAPIGLAFSADTAKLSEVAMASSRPTHSHSLAYQGAVTQAIAVAVALSSATFSLLSFLQPMRDCLRYFTELLQDTTAFLQALDAIQVGIENGTSCREMSAILGTGVTAQEAVPMAVYCFLRHPESYARVIHEAIFIGGDTDTIACMAGAISGAFLGRNAIPAEWLNAVREDKYTVSEVEALSDRLYDAFDVS